LAEEKYLRDVPDGHYAYEAVYDLIQRGVTGGYPDGTYRGKKLMNRFEIAAFISKLAKSLNLSRGKNEKLVEELKSEVSLLQYAREKAEKETQVSGDLQARWRVGQAPGQRGAKADYRLKTQVIRNFGERASLKINLDTMDAGFDAGTRDLVRDLLDFEGKVKAGSVTLKITSGPGDVSHVDDGLFPAENGMKYRRPRRTFSLSSGSERTDFCLEYRVRSTSASGAIDVAEISPKISQKISHFRFTLNPRLFYNSGGERDARVDLLGEFLPFRLMLGIAKTSNYPHGLYAKGEIGLGEDLKIYAQKVGSEYRQKFSYSIFDAFDRDLADGSTNYGLELKRDFEANWFARVKADYTNPGEVITTEFHLGRSFAELVYQTYGSSQALGMEANFKL